MTEKTKKKYRIYWDAGFGRMDDVVEASNCDEAKEMAYEAWNDEIQSNAEYGADECEGDCTDE